MLKDPLIHLFDKEYITRSQMLMLIFQMIDEKNAINPDKVISLISLLKKYGDGVGDQLVWGRNTRSFFLKDVPR